MRELDSKIDCLSREASYEYALIGSIFNSLEVIKGQTTILRSLLCTFNHSWAILQITVKTLLEWNSTFSQLVDLMISELNASVIFHWEMFCYWSVGTYVTLISRFYVVSHNDLGDFKKANWLHALEIHMVTMYTYRYLRKWRIDPKLVFYVWCIPNVYLDFEINHDCLWDISSQLHHSIKFRRRTKDSIECYM